MTLAPFFAQDAQALRETAIAVGLHLNLTEPGASHMPAQSLRQVIARSIMHQWSSSSLAKEIQLQLDAFETQMHRPPTHIDGHQHVHALPQVRDALMDVLCKRYPHCPPVLRSTKKGANGPTFANLFKAFVIETLGSRSMKALAHHKRIPTTRALLGVYGFDAPASTYLNHLTWWIKRAQPHDLIMCHPALDVFDPDALGPQRQIEFHVLSSTQFQQTLDRCQVHIALGIPKQDLIQPSQTLT